MVKARKKETTKALPSQPSRPDPGSEWEQVGDHWDEMHAFEDVGDVFEGIYLCSVDDVGPNKSMVHIFDVQTVRTGVWGSSVLDRRMGSVTPGHMVRITYESNEVNPASGRTYKALEVLQKKRPEKGFEHLADRDVPF